MHAIRISLLFVYCCVCIPPSDAQIQLCLRSCYCCVCVPVTVVSALLLAVTVVSVFLHQMLKYNGVAIYNHDSIQC
jgi:hypothetical protein